MENKDDEHKEGFISLFFAIVLGAIFSAIFVFPFGFFFIWIFGSFSAATSYTVPLVIIVSVLVGAAGTLLSLPSSKKNKTYAAILSIASLIVYFSLFSSFEFKSVNSSSEPPEELTDAEKRRINLNIECRDIGYSYGKSASSSFRGDSSMRDVVIPEKCRGLEATQRGIRLGFD